MSKRRWPRLATTLLLGCGLALAAQAVPPSVESVRALHQALGSERYTRDAMTQIEQQHADSIASAPAEQRADKAREHEAVSALLRELMAWPKLEPLAIEAFRSQLEAGDVVALRTFLASPAGRLYVDKYTPAVLQGTIESMALAGERAEMISVAVFDDGELPPPMVAPAAPETAREKAAASLINGFARSQFELQMAEMNTAMQDQLRALAPALGITDQARLQQELDAFASAFREDANVEAYMRPLVAALATQMDEDELKRLGQAFSDPGWKALEAKLDKANAAFQTALEADMQQRVLPRLIEATQVTK